MVLPLSAWRKKKRRYPCDVPSFTNQAARSAAPTHRGVQSQRAICLSGKLISEAAEAVILTLCSWKVTEGVGLAPETQVPKPRFSRAHEEGSRSGARVWSQYTDIDLLHTGAGLGITANLA